MSAQRPAGPRKPASSSPAVSSRPVRQAQDRPDSRSGRLRARISGVFFALLLGALSPFAAPPAAADVLVSNIGQTLGGTAFSFFVTGTGSFSHAQGFTTGSFSGGYVLSGIDVRIQFAGATSAQNVGNFRAELWSSDNSGAPDSKLASLSPPASASNGNNVIVAFTAPADTRLAANTAYHLVLYKTDSGLDKPRITQSTAEDAGGQTGWSVADSRHRVVASPPSGTWTKIASQTMSIRVNGSLVGAVTPPAAPADLYSDPSSGFGEVSLTWTAPAGTVTRYEVHYTSSTTVAPGAAVQTGGSPSAASGWVAVTRSATDTTASQLIGSLTGGTVYRVRVRAVNGGVASPWAFGRGVPRTAPATVAWSGTLTVKDLSGTADNGCSNVRAAAQKCSTAATLSPGNTFTAGTASYAITGLLVSSSGYFQMIVSGTPNAALRALKFCVGTTAFALSGIQRSGSVYDLQQSGTSLRWSPGDTVSLRVASSCAAAEAPTIPVETPQLDGLTLTANGEPLTLIQGTRHPGLGQEGSVTTGFVGHQQMKYMAVVPYDTTQVAVTAGFNLALGQVTSYADNGSRPNTLLTRTRAVQSGNSFSARLAPSVDEHGEPRMLFQRHTILVVRVYRRFEGLAPTEERHQTFYTIRIMQGGPITASLSVTPNPVPHRGRAKVKVETNVPLPAGVSIPLKVTHHETAKGDIRFLPNPGRDNVSYGLDRELVAEIGMRRGETEGYIDMATGPDPGPTANETFTIALDTASSLWLTGNSGGQLKAPWGLVADPDNTSQLVTLTPRPTGVPVVTIEARNGIINNYQISDNPVPEGDDAMFRLRASPAPASDLAVSVSVNKNRFTADLAGGVRTVTIRAGSATADFTVATVDDTEPDRDGPVAATVVGGTGYAVGSPGFANVLIDDDDGGCPYHIYPAGSCTPPSSQDPQGGGGGNQVVVPVVLIGQIREWRDDPCCAWNKAHTDRWDRVLKAFGLAVPDSSLEPMSAAEAQTYADRGWTRWVKVAAALREWEAVNAPAPVVTIAAGDPVTEGEGAAFTLTASPVPAADLAVAVSFAQRGAFADASALGARTVTIPAGTASAVIGIATVDDRVDEPDGAVVAALAAGSGYRLGAPARAVVTVADNDIALPTIVTDRAIAREGSDEAVVFTVRLNRAASHSVQVDYETADGAGRWAGTAPARAGADYKATSGTLIFAPGQTVRTVSVPILDDVIDEGMEHFLLRFSNPYGATLPSQYAQVEGLIRNDDPLQRMWLSRFGRAVSEQVLDAVGARTGGSAAPTRLTLGGHEVALDAAWPAEGTFSGSGAREVDLAEAFMEERDARLMRGKDEPAPTMREVSIPELLLASSFHMASAEKVDASTGRWSLWGRGARSSFSGARDALALEGDVTTATLGFDYERARWLVGVAFSRTSGDGSWEMGGTCDTGCTGEVESTLTGVWPYARYRVSDTFSVWGAVGFGAGEMTLTPREAASVDADVEMGVAAAGARGVVLPARAAGGFELALRADFLLTDTSSDAAAGLAETEAETSRVRLLLEGSRSLRFGGSVLTPSVEIGFRNDSGDAERGSGLEVGGGVRWASGGLTTEVRLRGLLAHSDSDYEEWGVSASVGYAPGTGGRGLTLRAGSAWGASRSGAERLWSQAAGLAPGGAFDPGPASFEAEVGYGVDAWGGLLTPFTGVAVTGSGETYRAGGRFRLAEDLTMSLEGDLRESGAGAVHGVALRGTMRW